LYSYGFSDLELVCGKDGRPVALAALRAFWLTPDEGYEAGYECLDDDAGTDLGIVSKKWPFGLCRGFARSSVNWAFASVEFFPR